MARTFDDSTGFGIIITPDEDLGQFTVRHSGINAVGVRTLREGQRVSFDVSNHPHPVEAVDVRVVD
jgi:CspA family cold shock protein